MTFLETLRSKAFWLIDAMRGGDIRRNLKLLSEIEGERPMADEDVDKYHQKAIYKLLRHCVESVPAYADMGYSLCHENPIKEWPIANKLWIKGLSGGGISGRYNTSDLVAMTTSGSTGTPFTSWQDVGKKRHVNAEVLHYNGKIGYEIGRRIIYFRSVVNEVAKSPLSQFMQNIHLIDCRDLSDAGIQDKLLQIKNLSKKNGAMILSYGSTLEVFRQYFEKYGYDKADGCNIYGIVSGSVMLHDNTRESMAKAFKCKVVSRYANEENGFLGQDYILNNVFIHNRAGYYIEILKLDSDEPTELGEVGRIVVTDLYNYAMPMIRYDTGDVGAWQDVEINGVKRRAIGKFGGRKVDMIFDCDGNPISPHSISNNMWKYPQIKQFQFIQIGRNKYLFRIISELKISEQDLIVTYKKILGQEAIIEIEYCDDIPVLASGKRRYIVNEMK